MWYLKNKDETLFKGTIRKNNTNNFKNECKQILMKTHDFFERISNSATECWNVVRNVDILKYYL